MSGTFCNVAAAVDARAASEPNAQAIVFPHSRDARGRVAYTHWSFEQLRDASDRLVRGLARHGVGRGTRTVLMMRPSLDFFALAFAMFRAGVVPVLVDPGIGRRNLGLCLAEARPHAFIGESKAHAARLLFGWARDTIQVNVGVGRLRLPGVIDLEEVEHDGATGERVEVARTSSEETAAILFTSGSTGRSKGVVYSHGNLAAQVQILRDVYGIESGETDLPTFAPFALFDVALGMRTVVPDMDFTRPAEVDAEKIVHAIQSFGVTNLFASPALLARVASYGEGRGVLLPSLRRVISAGAPVRAEVVERFVSMLPPFAQVYTPYGATEALPVTSIGSRELLFETREQTDRGAGTCIGVPVPGVEASVIRISDGPIPSWDESLELPRNEVGEIAVSGANVTQGYDGRPEATALARIERSGTGHLHRMGDLGYLDGKGRLWFCGRKSQRVVTSATTLFTIPCERVFDLHPDVSRSALVAVRRADVTVPVLCVELNGRIGARERGRIRAELLAIAAEHPHTETIQTILFHPAFPVDARHNSKIFREKLAVWAARRSVR